MYHRRFSSAVFLAAAFLLLLSSHFVNAQTDASSTGGVVRGVVKDQHGAVIPDAKVSATCIESGITAATKTNGEGAYSFSGLTPGHFRVAVTKQGFKTTTTSDFALESRATVERNLTLLVGSATETVQVTAASDNQIEVASSSGTRTDTPLIEVPQSIEVLNRALIADQDRRTLADALVNVSGVVPTKPEEILFTQPIVRGFPAEIYSDGLSLFGNTTNAGDPTSLVGLDRVEVVKGPSSTMYGGGLGSPLGGVINLVSERPTPKFDGFMAFRGGPFTTLDPYGDVNIPINEAIAARLSSEYQQNNSWIDLVDEDRWSLQPAMLFQLAPKTELIARGLFSHRNQLEYSGLPADEALAGLVDRNAFVGASVGQPHTVLDSRTATLELNHAFASNLQWNTSARWYFGQVNEHGSFILPGLNSPDPTPPVYQIYTMDMPSNPVREGTFDTNLIKSLSGQRIQHELLFGVSYDHTNFFSEMGFSGVSVGEENLAHPTYNLAFGPPTAPNLTQTDRYQTTAVYGQDQATYRRLHLTGSVRYTNLGFREREQGTNQTFNHISGRAGGTFDIAQGVALYAAYATAFRGAFGLVVQTTPKPETSENVEGGLKLALAKAHLASTIAIYDQTRNNVATPDPANFLYSVQTGQQQARGAETDLTWEPLRAFSVLANYAYTQATVTKDNATPIGNFLPRIPRNGGRIAARYRIQNGSAKGLAFGAGVTAFTKKEITLPNTLTSPGYAAIDAQASYQFGRYTLEGSAVNLTARQTYDAYEYFGFPVVMPNQPISAFVSLKVHLGKE